MLGRQNNFMTTNGTIMIDFAGRASVGGGSSGGSDGSACQGFPVRK